MAFDLEAADDGTPEAGGGFPVDPSRIVAGPVLRQHFEFGPEPGLPNPRNLVEQHQLGPFVVPEAFGGTETLGKNFHAAGARKNLLRFQHVAGPGQPQPCRSEFERPAERNPKRGGKR